MTQDREHERILSDGWLLQSSVEVGKPPEEVASPAFNPTEWLPGTIPSTVLAALVANGRCEDPYFGMNLKQVPTEQFDAPWWYRTEFSLSNEEANGTVLLEFDGVNYSADIWLNGRQIAAPEQVKGAYRRFQFDVTDVVIAGANVLVVKVARPEPGDFSTGFVDWNVPPPDGNMGFFRPVRLRFCEGVSLEHPFVRTDLNVTTLDEADLTISVDLVNHGDASISGILKGQIEAVDLQQPVQLEPGEKKTVVLTTDSHPELHFTHPRVWWPYELGAPELYELDLQFVMDDRVSDRRSIRFGRLASFARIVSWVVSVACMFPPAEIQSRSGFAGCPLRFSAPSRMETRATDTRLKPQLSPTPVDFGSPKSTTSRQTR